MKNSRGPLISTAAIAAALLLLVNLYPQATTKGGGHSGGGSPSGGTLPHTTDVLKGDGAGNGADAGFAGNAGGIISLFTGCSGTLYLGADQHCHPATAATSSSQLDDYALVNTSDTVLTMLSDCITNSVPCNLRQGSAVFTPPAAVTATISGTPSSDDTFWYLASNLSLTLGYNGAETITCSTGLQCVTGVFAFPYGSIPLWTAPITNNVWATINPLTMDKRAIYVNTPIQVGSGIASSYNPSTGLLSLFTDPTTVPRYTQGSGAPSGTCTAGRDFYTDTTGLHLYFCDAANTWKQADGGGGTVTESIAFPAAMAYRTGNYGVPLWDAYGPGLSVSGMGGVNSNPGAIQFDNSGAAEARFYYKLPHTWTGTISLTFGTETIAGTSGVVNTFTVKTACLSSGDDYFSPSYNMSQTVSFTSSANAAVMVEGSISSLNLGSCTIDQLLVVDVVKTDTNAAMNALYARLLVSHT